MEITFWDSIASKSAENEFWAASETQKKFKPLLFSPSCFP